MAALNKRLLISESHDDSNRCTPCRENSINMTRTLPTPVHTGGPRTWQPFTSRRQSWTESLLLRKRAPDTIHSTTADRSVGPYLVSLSSQPMKLWRNPNICRQPATRLTEPISPAYDRYVQYLLTGINPSVLKRHRRGLSHKNLRIATTLSPPFPSECSTGPPKWSRPVSILSIINLQQ
jgi:hypothetical protein